MDPREFFETLPTRVDPSKTAGVNKSYIFDIEGSGVWKVDVTDAGLQVTEGGEDADVTIHASKETFSDIAERKQNPTTAFMTGKLKIDGDMGAAMKLQKLF